MPDEDSCYCFFAVGFFPAGFFTVGFFATGFGLLAAVVAFFVGGWSVASRAVHVSGFTMPESSTSAVRWKATTARNVLIPNLPSAGPGW